MLRVKGYENGFISNPAVMSPTCTVSDLDDLKAERNISGMSRYDLVQYLLYASHRCFDTCHASRRCMVFIDYRYVR